MPGACSAGTHPRLPGLVDHATAGRALRLVESRPFDGGAVVLRYAAGTGSPR